MPNKMLIDATHPEETRVVVVRGNRVEEFDFETAQRKQLRGNIYLAKVTRVEPSLQAAFVEYGGNRHGFLAFSEIHPDYYQIPIADRQALIEADERAHREAEEEDEHRHHGRRRSRHRNSRRRDRGERVQSGVVEHAEGETQPSVGHEHSHESEAHAEAAHHDHYSDESSHEHAQDEAHDDVITRHTVMVKAMIMTMMMPVTRMTPARDFSRRSPGHSCSRGLGCDRAERAARARVQRERRAR